MGPQLVQGRVLSEPISFHCQLICKGIDRALRAKWSMCNRKWSNSETNRIFREVFSKGGKTWTLLDVVRESRLANLIAA